jgi:hypothetical protein
VSTADSNPVGRKYRPMQSRLKTRERATSRDQNAVYFMWLPGEYFTGTEMILK